MENISQLSPLIQWGKGENKTISLVPIKGQRETSSLSTSKGHQSIIQEK
jgi:hypothetical protein